ERRRECRVRVHDRGDLVPRGIDVAVKAPFGRSLPWSAGSARQRDCRNVFRPCFLIAQTARRDQKAIAGTRADVARPAAIDAELVHAQRRRDDLLAQGELAHRLVSGANSAASPPAVALQMPRSVMMPLSNRPGVTSNAGLSTRVPAGAITSSSGPMTSSAPRSSIAIASPSARVQSIVLDGTAAYIGIPLSFAASAFS